MSRLRLYPLRRSQVGLDIVYKIQDVNAKLNKNGVRDSRDQFVEKFWIGL